MSGKRNPDRIRVEVVYALRDRQLMLTVTLARGATARQVVERSGILQRCPEIDLARSTLGVFGRIASPDVRVRDGDRVEIYRPLIADPKETRRRKAGQSMPRSRRGRKLTGSPPARG